MPPSGYFPSCCFATLFAPMKLMRLLLFLLITSVSAFCQAQCLKVAGLTLGYGGGYVSPNEINRVIYCYNLRNESILTKKMPMVHWYHGPSVGTYYGVGKAKFEMRWVRKQAIVSAQSFDSATSVTNQRDVKITATSFNIGMNNKWKFGTIGFSADFGVKLRGYTRKNSIDKIGSTEWTKVFQTASNPLAALAAMIPTAYTIYYQKSFHPFGIRIYYQYHMPPVRQKLDDFGPTMLGPLSMSRLEDKMSNIGIEINFTMGTKEK